MAAAAEQAPVASATNESYLICATPRTGSYLLCDALAATGVAGRPTEYLMPGYREHWMTEWGVATYAGFHGRVLADGTTANGVFGAKLHAAQLIEFLQRATGRPHIGMEERPAVIGEWFPRPRYVWLRRRDAVGQAVSWAKACQTRIWWDADVAPAPPVGEPQPEVLRFDFGFIERSLYSLAEWDGVWRTHFEACGIEPLTIWYEDLVEDHERTVADVLAYLGLGTPTSPPVSTYRRQADASSAAWAARFERLEHAKRESTLAALAGLPRGERVIVCTGRVPVDQVPRDAVTIAVDGAASPLPASYALLTRPVATTPAAGVVVTAGRIPVEHGFVVPCVLHRGGPPARNQLAVDDGAGPVEIAAALAAHLGASTVEVVGR